MERIKEIGERLKEISKELNEKADELTADDVQALEKEVGELQEERKALLETARSKSTAEQRKMILDRIAGNNGNPEAGAGKVVRTFENPEKTTDPEDKFATLEYRKLFMRHVLRGEKIPAEYRANETTKTTDAGAVIPTTIIDKIVEKMEATGMILPLVTHTAYKGGVGIPKSTVKPVATWVAEGAGSDKQKKTVSKDAMVTFTYHKLRCAVAVSLEMDTMALSAFETTLMNNVVEAMTKALEQAIISGDGSGKPKGILKETVVQGQTIEVSEPAYADLINAEAALPIEYENGAVWCMTKQSFMKYFGLTDSNGQPIGRVNYGIEGKPERSLLGRTVICCNYLPSFASTLDAGEIFGFLFRFEDYALNTNYEMTVKKYEDNDTDDIVTKAIMLVDGKVVDENSLVVLAKKA